MYAWLACRLPRWLAALITGVWFALLLWAIFFATIADGVNFRYWRM